MADILRGRDTTIVRVGNGSDSHGDFDAEDGNLQTAMDAIYAEIPSAPAGVQIRLGNGRFEVTPFTMPLHSNVLLVGSEATEFVFTSPTPLIVNEPALGFGSGLTRPVTTDILGIYVPASRTVRAFNLTFRNIRFVGYTGTVTTPGHYTLIQVEGHNVKFEKCVFTNSESAVADLTSFNNYKYLTDRGVSTLTLVSIGPSRRVHPNLELAPATSKAAVKDCMFDGEPLFLEDGVLNNKDAALVAVRVRKVGSWSFRGNKFGNFFDYEHQPATDVIFDEAPNQDDQIIISELQPTTNQYVDRTFTFKYIGANLSGGTPQLMTEIAPDPAFDFLGNKLQMAYQFSYNVTQTAFTTTGAPLTTPDGFVQAYLAGDTRGDLLPGVAVGSVAAVRIVPLSLDLIDKRIHYPQGIRVRYVQAAASNQTPSPVKAITIRTIDVGESTRSLWKWSLFMEDTMGKRISGNTWGQEVFERAPILDLANAVHDDFGKLRWSEAGHLEASGNVGHTIQYGDAWFDFRSGLFATIGGSNQFGQVGLTDDDGSITPFINADVGGNVGWSVTFSDNPSAGDKVTFKDGVRSRQLTFVTSNPGTYDVLIGDTPRETVSNLAQCLRRLCDTLLLYVSADTTIGDYSVAASTTVTFSNVPADGGNIVITDAYGVSRTFTFKNSPTAGVITDIQRVNGNTAATAANFARGVRACGYGIPGSRGDDGVSASEPSSNVVTLTQNKTGTGGNTSITKTATNTTVAGNAFSGGTDGPWSLTVIFLSDVNFTDQSFDPEVTVDVGSVITVTNVSTPYLPCSLTVGADVHWSSTSGSYNLPMVKLRKCYGSVTVKSPFQHIRNIDPRVGPYPVSVIVFADQGDNAGLPWSIVPSGETRAAFIAIDTTANTGHKYYFEFDSDGHVTESGSNFKVDVSDIVTYTLVGGVPTVSNSPSTAAIYEMVNRMVDKINSQATALGIFAKMVPGFYDTGSGAVLTVAIYITSKWAGVNSNFVEPFYHPGNAMSYGGVGHVGLELNPVAVLNTGPIHPVYHPGSSNPASNLKKRFTISLSDCMQVNLIGITAVPFVNNIYSGIGLNGDGLVELLDSKLTRLDTSLFPGGTLGTYNWGLDNGFCGIETKLVYVETTDPNITSKVNIRGCSLHGNWGEQTGDYAQWTVTFNTVPKKVSNIVPRITVAGRVAEPRVIFISDYNGAPSDSDPTHYIDTYGKTAAQVATAVASLITTNSAAWGLTASANGAVLTITERVPGTSYETVKVSGGDSRTSITATMVTPGSAHRLFDVGGYMKVSDVVAAGNTVNGKPV